MTISLATLCFVFAAVFGALILLATSRRTTTLTCKQIILNLHPGQTRGLEELVSVHSNELTWRQVYRISGGFTGIWKRWANSVPLLQLAQLRGAMEPESGKDIERISRLKLSLSTAAPLAAMVTLIAPLAPHLYVTTVRKMLRTYIAMTDETHALYSDDSAPLCGHLLAAVL